MFRKHKNILLTCHVQDFRDSLYYNRSYAYFLKKDIFTQNKVNVFINLCSLNVSLKTTDRNFFELYILVYRRSKGGVIGNNIATALLNSCQLQKSCCDLALGICSKSAQGETFVLCDLSQTHDLSG